jgi:hypothetical protein
MGCRFIWALATLLVCTAGPARGATAPAAVMPADGPRAANASRTPEKRAQKHPKPRKSKKPARSSGPASAAS